MASSYVFNDHPSTGSIDYDQRWQPIQNDRYQDGWSGSHSSYVIQTMNCFGIDPSLQETQYTEVSRVPLIEFNAKSTTESPPWQPYQARQGYDGQVKCEGIAPWHIPPGHLSPSRSCLDDRMMSEQDSSSEGSTWSPGPSEHLIEMVNTGKHQRPLMFHSYYSRTHDHVQNFPSGYSDRSPSSSEASLYDSPQSGSGITLQEVQQFPDTCQEEQFSELSHTSLTGIKAILSCHTDFTESSRIPVDAGYKEQYHEYNIQIPDEAAKDARIASEHTSTKDEYMSGPDNDSGSDYSPAHREANSGRSTRSGKPTRPLAKGTRRTKAKNKTRMSVNDVTKRRVKKKSADTITVAVPVQKSSFACPYCSEAPSGKAALNKHITSVHTRPFTCTFRSYGCPSTFGSKNEWKRHVSTQHLRLGIWRCKLDSCLPKREDLLQEVPLEPTYNDFNRKDLFTQHLRRMHSPSTSAPQQTQDEFNASLDRIAKDCLRDIRSPPPYSMCGYCPAEPATVFEGAGSWEARMEHVGRHLESKHGETKQWREDMALREWMLREKLIENVAGKGMRLVGWQVEDGKSKRTKK